MHKPLTLYLFLIVAMSISSGSAHAQNGPPAVTIETATFVLPEPRIDSCIARADGAILVIGGRTSDGDLSSRVDVFPDGATAWQKAHLSNPIAAAAAISHEDAVLLIGGIGEKGVLPHVRRLFWTDDGVQQESLLDLPTPLAFAGAAILDNTLFVAGGIESTHADHASAEIHSLDLTSPDADWRPHDPLPQGGRLRPIMHQVFNEILIAGGWRIDAENGPARCIPTVDAWGFNPRPREGHREGGWIQRADMPIAQAAAAVTLTGQSHVMLAGGATDRPLLADVIDGTWTPTPTSAVLLFHDVTDTWLSLTELSAPIAQATLVRADDAFLVVGGADTQGPRADTTQINLTGTVRTLKPFDYAVIIIYFAAMALIGAYFARKQDSAVEFALGGRKVKWWAAAISCMATGVSTISFMAIPALVASSNLVFTIPVFAMIPSAVIAAYITFPLLRRLNITSTYEYLEHRFGSVLRLLGSFIGIMGQMLGRMSVVILLPALAIEAVTGIDAWVAILIMGVLTTIYSTAGGFEAVIWTDVTQGLLMLGGFVLLMIVAFVGIPGGMDTLIEYGRHQQRFDYIITDLDWAVPMIWFALGAQVFQIMAFASDQATAQRVLCTPMKEIRKLAYLANFFGLSVAILAAAVGLCLFGYFKAHPEQLNPLMKNDQLVPLFIVQKLPTGVAGLMVAALFAASMSTISTSVNTCAVLFSTDFLKRFKPDISSRTEMRAMQIASLVAGVAGTAMAFYLVFSNMLSLFRTMGELTALLGGGFVGVYCLGMFTRRTHEVGAIAGAIASVVAAVFLKRYGQNVHWTGWGVITTAACFLTGYLVSLIVPARRKDLTGLTVWDQLPQERKASDTGL